MRKKQKNKKQNIDQLKLESILAKKHVEKIEVPKIKEIEEN